MTTTTHFEDRLLDQLRRIVADNPDPDPGTAAQRAPRRTRLAVAGCGVAAATAAVAIVATSGDVTPSAYAVQPRKDGSVSVRIRSLNDADGLQRSLRAAGVPAFVSYDPAAQIGCAGPGAGVSTSSAPEPGATSSGAAGVARRSRHTSGDPAAGPSHTTGGAVGAGSGDAGPSLSGPGPADDSDDSDVSVVTSKWTAGPDGATFTLDPGHLKPGDKVYITTSSGTVSSIGLAIGTHAPSADCPPPPG